MFVSQSVDGVNELVILDAGDMPHDALAVGGPHVDAEPEMRSRYRHRFQSSNTKLRRH